MDIRQPTQVVTAHRQREGAGFVVRRPLPSQDLEMVDPFLLIDEMGPVDYGPGEAVGAPDHPHRGFETVTYSLAGEFEHEDSAGHRGVLRAGDVQWMTAGAGIVHSEMPSRKIMEEGGRVHGFQIWINLPARLKMTRPRYQEVPGVRIPTAETSDGLARVRVVAGEALGARAVIDTQTPIVYQDWTLEHGAAVTLALPREQRALAYGSEVRRVWPALRRRRVGAFIFFDRFGPVAFPPGRGMDVRPHPHIGLGTVTYLFEGEILHRDSLGSRQPIQPGDVNWMVAGKGI